MSNELKRINDSESSDRLESVYQRLLSIYNTSDSVQVLREVGALFRSFPDYKDSNKLAMACFAKARELEKRDIYEKAISYYEKGDIPSLNIAIAEFRRIPGYLDSDNMTAQCRERVDILHAEQRKALLEQQNNKKRPRKGDNDTFRMIFFGFMIASVIFMTVYVWNQIMALT